MQGSANTHSIQKQFADNVTKVITNDPGVIGLAVAGSWLTNEIDEFSDLDLILVTKEKISDNRSKMLEYAGRFGNLLSGFTGEHVGEPRVLICLYDDPLLHVDIKFLTPDELSPRIENPVILADTDGQLQRSFDASEPRFPHPDYQWLEDRFWIWIHYGLLKIGRGEYFEAMDFLSALRMMVLGPLLHIRNGNLPRGVRRVETQLDRKDLDALKLTLAEYNRDSLLNALVNCVKIYNGLRKELYDHNVKMQTATEKRVMDFLEEIKRAG